MKTRTIEQLLLLAKETNNIHTQNIIDILEKEKQRKEQKKNNSYKDHSFAYANGIALGIDPNYTIDQKKEIMNRAIDNSVIIDDYQRGFRDSNFQHGISQLMLSDLCKKLRKENDELKSKDVNTWNKIKDEPIARFLFNNIDKGYHITSTGKVIINDGDKFEVLFSRLAQAYLKQINQPSLTIIGK